MHRIGLTGAIVIAVGILVLQQLAVARPGTKIEGQPKAVCASHGTWVDARSGQGVDRARFFTGLTNRSAVLLGETHSNAEHHRWQLHTLSALQSRSEKLVIGFEMFPRRLQSVLDQWVQGALTQKAFLKAVDWRRTWGYDSDLYMPLFDFARMHRIPMIALNVERTLVSRVGAEGWESIPADEREGLSNPAKASPDYERALAQVYLEKMALKKAGNFHGMASMSDAAKTEEKETVDDILNKQDFKRFVAAQLTWDRAMAQGIAEAKKTHPGALIVGVMGSGHLTYFNGVPHQLEDLGISGSAVLIPIEAEQACDRVGTNYADALFTVRSGAISEARSKRPRLGVLLRENNQAALIDSVIPGSVAERTKLLKGDRIIRAAGIEISSITALVDIISRQAPGTWLPLTVERQGSEVDLVAKFPSASDQES